MSTMPLGLSSMQPTRETKDRFLTNLLRSTILATKTVQDRLLAKSRSRMTMRGLALAAFSLFGLTMLLAATQPASFRRGFELGIAEAQAATPEDISPAYRRDRATKDGAPFVNGLARGLGFTFGKHVAELVVECTARPMASVLFSQEADDDGGPLRTGHVEYNTVEFERRLAAYRFFKNAGFDIPVVKDVKFTMEGFSIVDGVRKISTYKGSAVVDGDHLVAEWHSMRGTGHGTLAMALSGDNTGKGLISARDSRRDGYVEGAATLTNDVRARFDDYLASKELRVTKDPSHLLKTKDHLIRRATKDQKYIEYGALHGAGPIQGSTAA